MDARTGFTLTALVLWSAACAPAGRADTQPRNVVLVVLDSVRADRLGASGYARPITPSLDALAGEGLLFERAYAGSSSTLQSLSTLWTGRLPSSGGHIGRSPATPHPSLVTLPRQFLRRGFRTGLAANLPALGERAFTRGFGDVEVDSVPGRWTGELVTAKALEIVDEAAGGPFFLTVGYADASEPHLPREDFRRRIDVAPPLRLLSLPELRNAAGALPEDISDSAGFLDLVARYDAEVAYVDACLGALVAGLRERGLLDDTLLVVTSTHGTELLEHGYVGSGWTLYDESLRVPLIVYAPGLIAAERVRAPVSTADLLSALLGDASSFAALPTRGEVLAELVVPALCILRASIQEDWKLIETTAEVPVQERVARVAGLDHVLLKIRAGELPAGDPWGEPPRRELYELAGDPAERLDLASSRPEVVDRLRELLRRYRSACLADGLPATETPLPASATTPDLEDLDRLQQVGYL